MEDKQGKKGEGGGREGGDVVEESKRERMREVRKGIQGKQRKAEGRGRLSKEERQ